jgi:hypothetical protein
VVVLLLALLALPATAATQERVSHEFGTFEYLATTSGVLVTAPHGTSDSNTIPIAVSVARRLGAGYLAFQSTAAGTRINVNRPTEGQDQACPNEVATERARAVYDAYVRLVGTAAGRRPLELYIELHGQSHPRRTTLIDTATKGITAADAAQLKGRFAAAMAAARQGQPDYPDLVLLIEPLDRISYTASCAKQLGVFGMHIIQKALHLEFPRSARRRDALETTAALTADLLRPLLSSRRR